MNFTQTLDITEEDFDFYYAGHRPPLDELRKARTEYYSRQIANPTLQKHESVILSETRYDHRGQYQAVYEPSSRRNTTSTEDSTKRHRHRFEVDFANSRHRRENKVVNTPVTGKNTSPEEDSRKRRSRRSEATIEDWTTKVAPRRDQMVAERRHYVQVEDSMYEPVWRMRRVNLHDGSAKATIPENVAAVSHQACHSHQDPLAAGQKVATITTVECLTCTVDAPSNEAAHLPCGHDMCHDCLKRLFELSTKDEQLMPPRCCTATPIALHHVANLFDNDFKARWNEKQQEFSTQNRMYCPKRGCGRWIKPHRIQDDPRTGRRKGYCRFCDMEVCGRCNLEWHGSSKCAVDKKADEAFARMANMEGWKECYNCKAMVELRDGCSHMTCICTA